MKGCPRLLDGKFKIKHLEIHLPGVRAEMNSQFLGIPHNSNSTLFKFYVSLSVWNFLFVNAFSRILSVLKDKYIVTRVTFPTSLPL